MVFQSFSNIFYGAPLSVRIISKWAARSEAPEPEAEPQGLRGRKRARGPRGRSRRRQRRGPAAGATAGTP